MEIVLLPHSVVITCPRLAPRNSVTPWTQAGQSFLRTIRSRSRSFVHPSNTRSSPLGGRPRRSFNASVDWIDAVADDTEFRMPAVSQVGREPGGGSCGRKHLKHAVDLGTIARTIPCVAIAPP